MVLALLQNLAWRETRGVGEGLDGVWRAFGERLEGFLRHQKNDFCDRIVSLKDHGATANNLAQDFAHRTIFLGAQTQQKENGL